MKLLISSIVSCLVIASCARAQVPEIADFNLPDIAMVRMVAPGQVAIFYNPNICQQAGPALCEFYKAHEYGHFNLGHAVMGTFPVQAEAEADCWAAQRAPLYAVQAAIQWFNSGGGTSWHHGTGFQRAQRVVACAQGR